MRKLDRWARIATGAALAAACFVALPSSSVADDDREGRFPGLPYVPCSADFPNLACDFNPESTNDFGWLNFPQVGLTGSVAAKQWARVPITMLASAIELTTASYPDAGDGEISNDYHYKIQTFFTSPQGSEDNYGDSALIPVRTVAFGSIPVEVVLQVSQRRDARNLPLPLVFRPHDVTRRVVIPGGSDGQAQTVFPASLEDRVNVRVRKVSVDGVDVGLRSTCETGPRARIFVESKRLEAFTDFNTWDFSLGNNRLEAEFDPTVYQYGIYGGTLNGTVDIPSFSGCATASGDDLSPLLTSAVSGSGNPLSIRIGAAGGCTTFDTEFRSNPVPPGADSPEKAGCTEIGYPNPKILVVPQPYDIPDYAPGEQPTP